MYVMAVKELTARLYHFWASDRSLTVLLVMVVITVFVLYPLIDLGLISGLWSNFFLMLTLVSGIVAVSANAVSKGVAVFCVAANFLLRWVADAQQSVNLSSLSAFFSLLFVGIVAATVTAQAFREGRITAHRICGAVVVYLLLGLMWSFAYHLIALQFPGAFSLSALLEPDTGSLQAKLTYFSFVTLTTVGYGDITAVHPVARPLVILEALTGQLFPAILIARLVSLEIAHRERGVSPSTKDVQT
jgi:voltage-gated potassium channel Kch